MRRLLPLLALGASACVGTAVAQLDRGSDSVAEARPFDAGPRDGAGAERSPSDSAPDRPAASDLVCAARDATIACDPLAASVCPAGSGCYLIKGSYLDCVCPPGTLAEGDACNASTECSPGQTCLSATSTPPGVCHTLCDPGGAACANGKTCVALLNYPTLGTCTGSGP
jgi:hypothetical protein